MEGGAPAGTIVGNSGWGWTICPTFWQCLNSSQRSRLVPATQIFQDALGGHLPSFSIVTPTGPNSQHPPQSVAFGDSNWVGPVMRAIEKSPQWGSTAIFLTWDDFGGFYDHVNPLQYNSNWGLRVPMVIISPYARAGFTDSTPTTFVGILAYVEHTFGLKPLNSADATAYDYRHAFNYSQRPLKLVPMVATWVPPSRRTLRLKANDPS